LWSAHGIYAFSRSLEGETFVVALNASDESQRANVIFRGYDPKIIFGSADEISVNDERLNFRLPARSGVIFK
jgi:hypothetical protein